MKSSMCPFLQLSDFFYSLYNECIFACSMWFTFFVYFKYLKDMAYIFEEQNNNNSKRDTKRRTKTMPKQNKTKFRKER